MQLPQILWRTRLDLCKAPSFSREQACRQAACTEQDPVRRRGRVNLVADTASFSKVDLKQYHIKYILCLHINSLAG